MWTPFARQGVYTDPSKTEIIKPLARKYRVRYPYHNMKDGLGSGIDHIGKTKTSRYYYGQRYFYWGESFMQAVNESFCFPKACLDTTFAKDVIAAEPWKNGGDPSNFPFTQVSADGEWTTRFAFAQYREPPPVELVSVRENVFVAPPDEFEWLTREYKYTKFGYAEDPRKFGLSTVPFATVITNNAGWTYGQHDPPEPVETSKARRIEASSGLTTPIREGRTSFDHGRRAVGKPSAVGTLILHRPGIENTTFCDLTTEVPAHLPRREANYWPTGAIEGDNTRADLFGRYEVGGHGYRFRPGGNTYHRRPTIGGTDYFRENPDGSDDISLNDPIAIFPPVDASPPPSTAPLTHDANGCELGLITSYLGVDACNLTCGGYRCEPARGYASPTISKHVDGFGVHRDQKPGCRGGGLGVESSGGHFTTRVYRLRASRHAVVRPVKGDS